MGWWSKGGVGSDLGTRETRGLEKASGGDVLGLGKVSLASSLSRAPDSVLPYSVRAGQSLVIAIHCHLPVCVGGRACTPIVMLDILELQLNMAVSRHGGARNQTGPLARAAHAPNSRATSPAPPAHS